MARGNEKKEIFLDQEDSDRFLSLLGRAKARFGFRLYAYCLMSNHFHLLMHLLACPLSPVMHWMQTCYAKYFNFRRQRQGHLFQKRFDSILCQDDSYFLELLRYIHLNPVRAGQVAKPEEWDWSGHGELSGTRPPLLMDADFPLALFHSDIGTARILYNQFIHTGITGCRQSPNPFEAGLPPPVRIQSEGRTHIPIAASRPSLDELAQTTCGEEGLSTESLRSPVRSRLLANARRLLVRHAISHGHRPTDIAAFLNCSPSVISKALNVP
jgi:putative transposase